MGVIGFWKIELTELCSVRLLIGVVSLFSGGGETRHPKASSYDVFILRDG